MGMMIDGHWQREEPRPASRDGRFHRTPTTFRRHIGDAAFPAEAGRYHLYASLACPWAHRTLIMRRLKQLEQVIPLTITHPHMLDDGWRFEPPEPLYGFRFLYQLYQRADAHYTGRVSVPVLWDQHAHTIVNNESADIMRIFNRAFDDLTGNHEDFYPPALQADIDEINAFVYERINNGVYRCGFATRQEAYDEAFASLFAALDTLEQRLQGCAFLVGERLTEADIRLFTTLIRFDVVYHGHFKCNRNRIQDMPNLWRWLRRLYAMPAFRETTNFEHIRQHYYYSHVSINPTRIVPAGPVPDLSIRKPDRRKP